MGLWGLGVETAVGALVGYLTNDIAVKMLFRRYGPFGGVIVRTRDKFINGISDLVEREIINHDTIGRQLSSDDFRAVLTGMVQDFFRRYLYDNTGSALVQEVPGMTPSLSLVVEYFEENSELLVSRLLGYVLSHLPADIAISRGQLQHLADRIVSAAIERLSDSTAIEDAIRGLYREHGRSRISDFVPPGVFRSIAQALQEAGRDFHVRLKAEFEEDLDELVGALYAELGVSDALARVESSLKQRSLAELLGRENAQELARESIRRTLEFLKTADGRELVRRFAADLLAILRRSTLTLFDLLSPETQTAVERLVWTYLPGLVAELIAWVRKHKDEIDGLIDEAINETLRGEEGTDGGSAAQLLRSSLKALWVNLAWQGKAASRTDVMGRFIGALEAEADAGELSMEFAGRVVQFIKTRSIGEIVGMLEAHGVVTAETLANLIERAIDASSAKLDASILDKLLERHTVGEIVSIDLVGHFDKRIKEFFTRKLKDDFLFTERAAARLHEEISSRIIAAADAAISDAVPPAALDRSMAWFKTALVTELTNRKADIAGFLAELLEGQLKEKTVSDLVSPDTADGLVAYIREKLFAYLANAAQDLERRRVDELYDWVNSRGDSVDAARDLLASLVSENLPAILAGRIRDLVAGNLGKLSDKDLQKVVEDFMGRELRPITTLGAILGGLAGLAFYSLGRGADIPGALGVLASMLLYGFVGYGTNVIALKMVFRPYQQWKVAGIPIPGTPGIVAKNKPAFAKGMASFMDEELLNPESVFQMFKASRGAIEAGFVQTLSADGCRLIRENLMRYAGAASDAALAFAFRYAVENERALAAQLAGQIGTVRLGDFDLDAHLPSVKLSAIGLARNSRDAIDGALAKALQTGLPLAEVLPAPVKDAAHRWIEGMVERRVDGMVQLLDDRRRLDKAIRDFLAGHDEALDKRIDELISPAQMDQLKASATEALVLFLRSERLRSAAVDHLWGAILKEADPERSLAQLFDGMLAKLLEDNRERLVDAVLERAQGYLRQHRREIKDAAVRAIKRELEAEKEQGALGWLSGLFKGWLLGALDVYTTVEAVVDRLIDDKLPSYLAGRRTELGRVAEAIVAKVRGIRLADAGFHLSRAGVENLVDRLLADDAVPANVGQLLGGVLDAVGRAKVGSLLRTASMSSLADLASVFEREIDIAAGALASSAHDKREKVQEMVSGLAVKVFDSIFLSIPVSKLTASLEQKDISRAVRQVMDAVASSSAVDKQLDVFLRDMADELGGRELRDLVSTQILGSDLAAAFEAIITSPEARDDLRRWTRETVEGLIADLDRLVAPETREWVLRLAVKSLLDAVEGHFVPLIRSLHIQEVTEREVNAMSPKKVEELFYSFAGIYFRRLELYGWAGGLFGLIGKVVQHLLS